MSFMVLPLREKPVVGLKSASRMPGVEELSRVLPAARGSGNWRGRGRGPPLGSDGDFLIDGGGGARGEGLGVGSRWWRRDGRRVCDGDVDGDLLRGVGLVDDGVLDVDGGLGGVGGEVGGGNEGAVFVEVDGVGEEEVDVAVDAGAGIPAGSGLLGVVGADGEEVVAGVEVAGEFVAEGDVAVGAVAEVESVDPDVGVGHDAVEGDEDLLVSGIVREGEVFAVPTDAVGEEGGPGASEGCAGRRGLRWTSRGGGRGCAKRRR